MEESLKRFHKAHILNYEAALAEIRTGRKLTHWMWFIFPQLKGLGHSDISVYYSIEDLNEAKAFLSDPVLGAHLKEISESLINLKEDDPHKIFGSPDDRKLQSSMTLFSIADGHTDSVFIKVLNQYYAGKKDQKTVNLLSQLQ